MGMPSGVIGRSPNQAASVCALANAGTNSSARRAIRCGMSTPSTASLSERATEVPTMPTPLPLGR